MSSGWIGSRRIRVDDAHETNALQPAFDADASPPRDPRLHHAIGRTRDFLLSQQHPEGYWVGELEGDTILESEYILLLAFMGRGQSEKAVRAANYLLQQQLPEGGWAIYPGGPLEVSASVKAYFALKIAGHSPEAPYMQRACSAIRAAGGAERVNSFTRYYLALLGVITYEKCPAVPPELILIPRWLPFNIYEMSAWSRTIVVPLSILWAYRPAVELPADQGIRELFINSPEQLPPTMGPAEVLDDLARPTRVDWGRFFRRVDLGIKFLERWHIRPLRKTAVRRAAEWMLQRFHDSDGLGAIFPPIIWSVIALKCLGYGDDSSEVQAALAELDKLTISDADADHLEPCRSPVWDTAIATIALRDAGVSPGHKSLRRAVGWLLSKEVRCLGDWAVHNPNREASGWFFEFNNAFYPDVDDTGMVCIALSRCLPAHQWSADFLLDDASPRSAERGTTAVLTGRGETGEQAASEIESMQPLLAALRRGARWILMMQSNDGGWGAFDRDNTRELFTRVPFADHNAMIDPSTSDLTARMVEMFAGLNVSSQHPAIRRALDFVWNDQQPDHCWYGRWGVNYIYGTWQALVGLTAIGVPPGDPRIRGAVDWLKSKQQACGGWGETPRSYDDPSLRGQGPPTPSQTAWALIGLIAAGEARSPEVARGIQYLLDTQQPDGTWQEEWFTGTGFPRVFYLKYHLYRIYFPLMALARYNAAKS